MSEENRAKYYSEAKEKEKKLEVRPYEEVKKFLDERANETAYRGAIEFSKLFKGAKT